MKKQIFIFLTILVAFAMQSCSDMNELSDRFLNEGETIYASMIDTAMLKSGEDRVKIDMLIKTNRTQNVRIFWNDRTDSTDVDIYSQTGVFTKIIDNLPEKDYIFNLISFDLYGNSSLVYEVSGKTYGINYRNSLVNRGISSMSASAAGKTITWSGIGSLDAKYCEISYTNLSDQKTILKAPVSETNTLIPDMKGGTSFEYRTVYVPDNSLDTFYTNYREYQVERFFLEKTGWAVEQYSSEYAGIGSDAVNIIDGIYDNRWHTWIDPVPHWIIIDFGAEVAVSQFGIWSGLDWGNVDPRYPSEFELYTRSDKPDYPDTGTGWTKIGTFNTEPALRTQIITIDHPVPGRYLKFVATKNENGSVYSEGDFMVMGEFDIYI